MLEESCKFQNLAGFFQHGGISISTFISWVNEVCVIPSEWALYPCESNNNNAAGGAALDPRSGNDIQPGNYVILTPPPESWKIEVHPILDLPRRRIYSISYTHTPRDRKFMTRIRDRDSRCCISGIVVAAGDYTPFDAAHIFPLGETDIWRQLDYKRFIEDDQVSPGQEINSVQQGFLCLATVHRMFDAYTIGVNPDENYRIYDFVGRDPKISPHGGTFYLNPNEQRRYLPSPDLLRDHFRQCVLQCVKGAGDREKTHRPDNELGASGFDLSTGSWWSNSERKGLLEEAKDWILRGTHGFKRLGWKDFIFLPLTLLSLAARRFRVSRADTGVRSQTEHAGQLLGAVDTQYQTREDDQLHYELRRRGTSIPPSRGSPI